MSTATLPAPAPPPADPSAWMTTEEFLALPDNPEVERWLLYGKVVEQSMIRRSFSHARTEAKLSFLLTDWNNRQLGQKGLVVSGEAGFRLSRNPDLTVGVDVAYLSPEQVNTTARNARLIEGPPVLAVEILSATDRIDDVSDKIHGYLDAGVKLAWRVEPVVGLVTVFRPGMEPEGFNIHGFLDGGTDLPGFRVAVSEVFA